MNTTSVLLSGLSTDRVELNLARAMFESGIHLHVIGDPDSPAETLCRSRGIPFTGHAYRHRFDRAAVALYRRLRDQVPFDIFHCLSNRSLSTALLATRNMANPPKIIAYRGTMGHLSRLDPASWFSYLNPRVDRIICVSNAVREYLLSMGLPDSRLTVIWKGHEPSWYVSAPRRELAGLGVPEDAVAVNFTGNMRPVKGVGYLLEAFDGIAPEENIHLLLIGEVRDKCITRRIGKQANVHFTGFRKDATALAGACDLAVMPSIEREGLPKAALEAMAQGVPPVVTDVGGMPELVVHGVCGLVIPPRDADALRASIRQLARDSALRKSFGAAARRRVEHEFHFRHTLEKTLALYRAVLNGC